MSSSICFDRTAKAKRILKNGVHATSAYAKDELRTAAWYLINKTTYSTKRINERLRSVSSDYFKGMPGEYIDASVRDIISSTAVEDSSNIDTAPKAITIYREELEQIEKLGHDDTERLAFVFLCVAKMFPYSQIYECNSELYQLAWRYRYDSKKKVVIERHDGRRVGGNEPTNRVNRLCQEGIVRYSVRINKSSKQKKPSSAAMFSVPIVRSDGDIAFVIDAPDEDSLVLYYDRYKGYGGIITCEHCGKPVLKTGRRQKYCAGCADEIKHCRGKKEFMSKIAS